VRRSHCVGGGAPVNFGRRPKNVSSKILEKISFYPQNFLMTSFSHRKLGQQNQYAETITIASAAPTSYRRRRGAAGARF